MQVTIALLLTILAGLATGVGSVMALFAKRSSTKFLAASLGFSAGVMLYVSMVEIFQKAKNYLAVGAGEKLGCTIAAAAFFAGILFIGLIDYLVPSAEGDIGNLGEHDKNKNTLERMGILTALAIGIHNFPEGLATFTSALKEPHLGIAIATAIAIHNIPEGIATSIPIYYSTGSRKKSFLVSFFSGITEPLGAVIGYLILRPFFNDTVFGILFGFIAGIMVFISIEELLPMAREYEKSRVTIIGCVSGMAVMAVSLLLFM
ncbi:MAG: zinc transporter ZupT [Clostridiales bacterium]|nr:zinc transporter ZupT [Clostridiales bacterium]